MSYDSIKSAHAIAYVSKKSSQPTIHKVFKILYFADMKHYVRYGTSIFSDRYIAMKHGPVPSRMYDEVKAVKQEYLYAHQEEELKKIFSVPTKGHKVTPLIEADLELFSETELECLNESLSENARLGFQALTNKSHGLAWTNANRNEEISSLDIAKEGGASKDMIAYMKLIRENEKALNQCL